MTTKAYKPFPAENCERIRYLTTQQEQSETERKELFETRDQLKAEIDSLGAGETKRRQELLAQYGETVMQIERLKVYINWCTGEIRKVVRQADQTKLGFVDPHEPPPPELFEGKDDDGDEAKEIEDGESMFSPGPYTIVRNEGPRYLIAPRNMQDLAESIGSLVTKAYDKIAWKADGTARIEASGKVAAHLVVGDHRLVGDPALSRDLNLDAAVIKAWNEVSDKVGKSRADLEKFIRDGGDLEATGMIGPSAAALRRALGVEPEPAGKGLQLPEAKPEPAGDEPKGKKGRKAK